MGGNLWFMGVDTDSALLAAEWAQAAAEATPGVITPFPGGIASSGSKAGSRYSFSIASTYAEFRPDAAGKAWCRIAGAGRRQFDHGSDY